MKTAIDTSVLYTIFNDEPGAAQWLDLLVDARRQGQLIICEVVYAELAPAFADQRELAVVLRRMGISFEAVSPAAAWKAGACFTAYRAAGGPREHLIPDFLIAAHALVQADQLAAIDRGYIRRWFADLKLLLPSSSR